MNLNFEAFYFINNSLSNPLLDAILPHLTNCGSLVTLSIICLIALILTRKDILGLGKYYRLVKLCIASLILCVVITSIVKLFFNLPRPSLVLSNVHVLTSSVDPNSFPSGHTACTFSIVTVLLLKSKEYFERYLLVRCLLVIYAILIAFSRVYIGMHFPLDVIVGGLIGIISGIAISKKLEI